jgi:ABC-type multidrug transport system ATPase subunit
MKEIKQNKALILTTHSMEEADLLCDRIAVLVDGRL